MNRIFMLLCCLLVTIAVQGQRSDTEAIQQSRRAARANQNRHTRLELQQIRLAELGRKAAKGDTEALYNYGVELLQRANEHSDSTKALQLVEQAAEAGYAAAQHLFGVYYKYGRLVEYDLARSFQYFDRAADQGYPLAFYSRGFMLYKGLGCTQDYQAAVADFTAGSKLNQPLCMYMLGLCNRNGFGVPKDIARGDEWLRNAMSAGVQAAQYELERVSPEVDADALAFSEKSKISQQLLRYAAYQTNEFNRVNDLAVALNEENYTGFWVKYDWSGEYILEAQKIDLTCSGGDKGMACKLTFPDQGVEYTFSGSIADNNTFSSQRFTSRRNDRYVDSADDLLSIDHLDFGLYHTVSDETILLGAVNGESTFEREPERPIKLMLQAKPSNSTVSQQAKVSLSPNPVIDQFAINLELPIDDACRIVVHDMNGQLIYQSSQTKLTRGSYVFPLMLDLQPGTYFVSLQFNYDFQTLRFVKI